MGPTTRDTQPSDGDLARRADGSLPPERESALRGRVSASPELAEALAAQDAVVSLLRSADDRAPAALRLRIEAMTTVSAERTRRPRPRRILLSAATALAVIAAVVAGVSRNGQTVPSVSQTAELALAAPTAGAPAEDASSRGQLAVSVDRVSFPYWRANLGWRAVGTRTDVLRAQTIVTVYYADRAGARVGYSIVAGPSLNPPAGHTVERHGVRFSLLRERSLHIVAWLRSGHTCVVSSPAIGEQALLRLASSNPRRPASPDRRPAPVRELGKKSTGPASS